MFGQPGKKLLFMGAEFAQEWEWNVNASLDWRLLVQPEHEGIRRCVRDLNRLYRQLPALHQLDCDNRGFAWIDCNDRDNSVVSWLRKAADPNDFIVLVANFTPVPRDDYRLGVPKGGWYFELLNTDSTYYGGSNIGLGGGIMAEDRPWHGQPHSISLRLPPLAAMVLQPELRQAGS
jgi:1,4-alpha-glucan branching enzyme